jgi:tocopherol cyclase
MKRSCVLIGLVLALLSGCSACPPSTQPYNCLVWNRENVLDNNGKTDTGPWFEWWYYKVILPETGETFYFVYGVVNPWDTANTDPASRSYVGFGSFADGITVTQNYAVADFQASYDRTDISIADQRAVRGGIAGHVFDGTTDASWNIDIDTKWEFNAMGWAMFAPDFTNIYWYPAQAAALFTGTVVCNGKTYTFEDVPGYQDRNWGRNFPDWWAWITANHFAGHPDTALAAGGGRPELLGLFEPLDGLAIGLKHDGIEYNWRPNDGDLQRFTIDFGTWRVESTNRQGYKIEIEAKAPCDSFMDLVFMTPQNILFHDFETLTGALTVRLSKREGLQYRLMETLQSDFAGIEYGSATATALDCHEADSKVLYDNFPVPGPARAAP